MPIYEYKCKDCDQYTTKMNRIAKRELLPPTCECGGLTEFRISIPMINASAAAHFNNYQCPVTGETVTSARQKKYIEDKEGLIIKEKGIFPPRKKKFVDETPKELKQDLSDYRKTINL